VVLGFVAELVSRDVDVGQALILGHVGRFALPVSELHVRPREEIIAAFEAAPRALDRVLLAQLDQARLPVGCP
jgi:hypothetical protein